MKVVILSQLILLICWLSIADIDARSTQVSAQYTVGDSTDGVSSKRFNGRGIVEDEVLEDVDGFRNYNKRPARNASRIHKKRAPITPAPVYDDTYEPEFFAVKGKVLDEEERTVTKPRTKQRKAATSQTKFSIVHPLPSKNSPSSSGSSSKGNFRFPSINNEEIFESKLLESSSQNEKKYKSPTDQLEEELYAYSTLKFDKDNGDYNVKSKAKPKKSSQYIVVDDTITKSKRKYQEDEDDQDDEDFGGHFRPSTKFQQQSNNQKFPSKLFKSEQDEYKDEEYEPIKNFEGKVIKQKPLFVVSSAGKIKKINNKFDPQMQGGFKPSVYKLREITNGYGSDGSAGHGVAGPGQIKNYYNVEENEETRGKQSSKNGSPASRAQYQQFLKAKEDERIERLVEEQFKLQQQKQIQVQKEKELQQQQQLLQLQKQKLQEAEKQLNGQATRQKRRPNQPGSSSSSGARRQRNPSPITFAGTGSGSQPKRTVTSKDGSYRVSFNIQ